MAWTSADLERIDTAIASGTLSVRFSDGRMVTYQSTEAMLRARAVIWAEANAASAAPVNRSSFADVSR
jgi:roadblock/LC7 domain-containing protein